MACAGCHNLNELQSDDSLGQPGPHFGNLAEIAASRVEGEDAATYIYNSITNPNGYVVPGYVQNIMPQNFGETMTEEEIQSMVAWLLE